jgi:hypothetical protein
VRVRGPPTTWISDTSRVQRACGISLRFSLPLWDLMCLQAARAASTLGRSAPLGLGLGAMRVTAQRRTPLQVTAAVAADAPVQKKVRSLRLWARDPAWHPMLSVSAAVCLIGIDCAMPISGGLVQLSGHLPSSSVVALELLQGR